MRLYDRKNLVDITMNIWTGDGYTPDWSADFFATAGMEYDSSLDAFIVDDVEYCIDQANDWKNAEGDFYDPDADPEEVDNRNVDVEYKKISAKTFEGYVITACTAIAGCDNEDEAKRQPALLVVNECNGETCEMLVFGYSMPEDLEDFHNMCCDSAAWEPLADENRVI